MIDQDQWAHAFGNVWFPPWVDDQSDPILGQFQWFWGKTRVPHRGEPAVSIRKLMHAFPT